MSNEYKWTGVLGDLVQVRGSKLQLAQYVAVMVQLRRSLDDWVRLERMPAYLALMDKLGLHVEIDCRFVPLPDEVFGISYAPTTRAAGARYVGSANSDPHHEVHVIVSRRKDWAQETLAVAWYPLALEGRIVTKPMVDHLRLGLAFGYPPCCVDFFSKHNDWPRQNTIAEAAKASKRTLWQANCIVKLTQWMLIFHMPCSFNCEATVAYSNTLVEALRELDEGYVRRVLDFARQPFLVINERTSFVLQGGKITGPEQGTYRRAVYLEQGLKFQDPRERRYAELLSRGDSLTISDGIVYVHRLGRLLGTLETRCDLGVAEVPTLLDFQ